MTPFDEPAPQVLDRYIQLGMVTRAGVTYAAPTSRAAGLKSLSVAISHRSHADFFEKLLAPHGWVPRVYRQWAPADQGGSISFMRKEEAGAWRLAGFT